jgi:hypothetical protein
MSKPQSKDSANNADADTGSTKSVFPKKFVFITDNSTEERKKARAHAVREHHRRRKWQDTNAPNPRIQLQLSWRRKEGSAAGSEDQPDSNRQTLYHSNVISVSVCCFALVLLF